MTSSLSTDVAALDRNDVGGTGVSYDVLSRYRGVLMGVQILLIIAFHYTEDIAALRGDGFDGPARVFYRYIGSSGVDVFLVMSGLGLYYSWRRCPDLGLYYRKRFIRVLIPYAFVAIVGWIWLDMIHHRFGAVRFLKDLLFITFFTDDVKWFWYILVCLVCYLSFPKIRIVIDGAGDVASGWLRALLLCGLCMQCVVMLDFYDPELYDNIDILVNRLPSFIIGCLMGRLAYEHRRYSMRRVFVELLIVSVMLYPLRMAVTPVVQVFLRALLNLLLCLFALGCLEKIPVTKNVMLMKARGLFRRLLSWFGMYSLELYLLHVLVRKILFETGHAPALLQYEAFVILLACLFAWPLHAVSTRIGRFLMSRYAVRAAAGSGMTAMH